MTGVKAGAAEAAQDVASMTSEDRPHPRTVRLFLSGDVMTGRGVDQALACPGEPELREPQISSAVAYLRLAERENGVFETPIAPAGVWEGAKTLWDRLAPDLRLMNLETAVTTSDDFADKPVCYRMNPANMPALAASGANAFALANNHILDFGPAGLADTLAALGGAGIAAAGAGLDLAEARAPAVLETGAARVLVFAIACPDSGVPTHWAAAPDRPGLALLEPSTEAAHSLATRIAERRRPGDLAVLSVHWGSNWGYEVPHAHRRFAHALIESGEVCVIHGHSSHHPRPIEVHRGRLILYGCGDFLNDYEGIQGYEAFRSQVVAGYFADLDAATGALQRLRLAPLEVRNLRLQTPRQGDAAWLAGRLSDASARFGVALHDTGDGLIEARWGAAD